MLFGIAGNMGAGKTLFLTAMANMWHNGGASVYANYKLKGFKYGQINDIEELLNVKTRPNFAALDELWISADSYNSMGSLNRLIAKRMLQHRKKDFDVGMTVQDWIQLSARIRRVTTAVFFPQIIKFDEENGKPTLLEIYYTFRVSDYLDYRTMKSFLMPVMDHLGKYVCDMYDTEEIIDEFDDPKVQLRGKLIEEYAGYEGMKKDLVAKFVIEYGLARGDASVVVDYIQRTR